MTKYKVIAVLNHAVPGWCVIVSSAQGEKPAYYQEPESAPDVQVALIRSDGSMPMTDWGNYGLPDGPTRAPDWEKFDLGKGQPG